MRASGLIFAIMAILVVSAPAAVAQRLAVDVGAGRVVYDPVSAAIGLQTFFAGLRFDVDPDSRIYGAAGPATGTSSTSWGAAGVTGRLTPAGGAARRVAIGVDAGAHGFVFRDGATRRAGHGGTVEALAFLGLGRGRTRVEVRGGARAHALTLTDATSRRAIGEAGVRLGIHGPVAWAVDARAVRATEGVFPFAGVTIASTGTPLQVWAHAGRWFRSDLGVDDVEWRAGLQMAVGARSTIWASARQDARDPLYWNPPRRSWTVGVTHRLGRVATRPVVSAPSAGRVTFRVAARDVPGDGAPSVAGDFNDWRPVPMPRDGRDWTIVLPLASGVYRYAFRAADGTWFVPASAAGRRDDGMGGQVAVVVVR